MMEAVSRRKRKDETCQGNAENKKLQSCREGKKGRRDQGKDRIRKAGIDAAPRKSLLVNKGDSKRDNKHEEGEGKSCGDE